MASRLHAQAELIRRTASRVPLYPFLFGWFSVLFLYGENPEHVPAGTVVPALILVTSLTVIILFLGWFVFRNGHRAALLSVITLILGLSYGHVWSAVAERSVGGVVVGRDMFLVPLWIVLAGAGTMWISRLRSEEVVSRVFRVVVATLLMVAMIQASIGYWHQRPTGRVDRALAPSPRDSGEVASDARSIYYLIFDRYGGESTIHGHIKYENRDFYEKLEELGFYVANESVSNYPKTVQSLASSLNMVYLQNVADQMGRMSSNWSPLYEMINNPRIAQELRSKSLLHVHVGSAWDWSKRDRSADVNVGYPVGSAFFRDYMQTTAAWPIIKRIDSLKGTFGRRRVFHDSTLFQFEKVRELAHDPRPKFVFAHFLVPHDPYTFDRHGEWISQEEERKGNWWEMFAEQLQFTNKKIVETVEEIINGADDRDPIIILQADEGVYPHNILYGLGSVDWREASEETIKLKFPILNAYYMPCGEDRLYPQITPVNTFRLILSECYGANYPLLPDEAYIFGDGREPYQFKRVTELVLPDGSDGAVGARTRVAEE